MHGDIPHLLPYIALAVLCPAAYEQMFRTKLASMLGESTDATPHAEGSSRSSSSEANR